MILAISCGILVLVFIYFHLTYSINYWKRKNVPFISTSVFSLVVSFFYFPNTLFDYFTKIYVELKGHKYGGIYFFGKPYFVARDPELIKHILTKDFEHFRDRGFVLFEKSDSLTNHMFSAPGNLWKALRIRLTPTFTSGKMKFMYGTVKECAEEYQQILEKTAAQDNLLNFKDASVGYTIEVISSTAFGWKSNSIQDSNSEFRRVAMQIFTERFRFTYVRILNTWFPLLKPYLSIYLIAPWIRNFFFKTVHETIEYRKKTGYKRNDFLQLLMTINEDTNDENEKNQANLPSSHASHEFKLTNELLTAQCFIFFVAGFDTSSFILTMTLLEMAMNPDIQRTLQQEIDHFTAENEGKITYEMMKDMPYLHKVVQETLRMYPVLPFLARICTKAYNVPDTDLILEKGTEVLIPISGMHRDAEFYPNPEVYDPERFNDEEIKKRHHYAYLPFGEGPRNCIGSRFGLMTVKLAVIHILKKYNLSKTPKTKYPIEFLPKKLVSDCKFPVLLQCSLRQ